MKFFEGRPGLNCKGWVGGIDDVIGHVVWQPCCFFFCIKAFNNVGRSVSVDVMTSESAALVFNGNAVAQQLVAYLLS